MHQYQPTPEQLTAICVALWILLLAGGLYLARQEKRKQKTDTFGR